MTPDVLLPSATPRKQTTWSRSDRRPKTLVQARYLLAEDVDEIIGQAAQHYDLVCGQN